MLREKYGNNITISNAIRVYTGRSNEYTSKDMLYRTSRNTPNASKRERGILKKTTYSKKIGNIM